MNDNREKMKHKYICFARNYRLVNCNRRLISSPPKGKDYIANYFKFFFKLIDLSQIWLCSLTNTILVMLRKDGINGGKAKIYSKAAVAKAGKKHFR